WFYPYRILNPARLPFRHSGPLARSCGQAESLSAENWEASGDSWIFRQFQGSDRLLPTDLRQSEKPGNFANLPFASIVPGFPPETGQIPLRAVSFPQTAS
ncbi:MAG: hypothetical protein ACK6D4_06555, partial [Planctomyces sp.]